MSPTSGFCLRMLPARLRRAVTGWLQEGLQLFGGRFGSLKLHTRVSRLAG